MATTKSPQINRAQIAATYRKAERIAAAARHAAAIADTDASLNAVAVRADADLAMARAAYWQAGF